MVRRKTSADKAKAKAKARKAARADAPADTTPHRHADPPAAGEQASVDLDAPVAAAGLPAAAVPEDAVEQLRAEAEELRDRHLRLAAEFDNYRKRTARERSDLSARAQASLVGTVLEALDDLGRVAHLDPDRTGAQDVIAGVELVERKLMRQLESAGLVRVGTPGEPFDPNNHEAVGTEPAPSPAEDGVLAAVLQPGYRFGRTLLRPARVRVYVALEGSSDEPGASDA